MIKRMEYYGHTQKDVIKQVEGFVNSENIETISITENIKYENFEKMGIFSSQRMFYQIIIWYEDLSCT